MLLHILAHTPSWVFVLFIALLWLGLKQMFRHEVSLVRVSALAAGMSALSVYGTASVFGAAPPALVAWFAAAAAALAWMLRRGATGARYDPARRRFTMPGSSTPLALMMGIFFTKYAAGIALSLQPGLARDAVFAVGVSALYGAFSGVFAARAVRLWRLALAEERRWPVRAA